MIAAWWALASSLMSIAGMMEGVDLRGRESVLAGQVIVDGKPAPGTMVIIAGAWPEENSFARVRLHRDLDRRVVSDEQGMFRIPVADGRVTYTLYFLGAEGGTADETMRGARTLTQPVTLRKRKEIPDDAAAALRVVDPAGQAVPGAVVIVTSRSFNDGDSIGQGGISNMYRSGPDGVVKLHLQEHEGAAAGGKAVAGLGVRIVADGLAPMETSIQAGKAMQEVRLNEGRRIAGLAMSGDEPMAGAWVDLRPTSDRNDVLLTRQRVRTNERGEFVFENAQPSREYWIVAAPWDQLSGFAAGPMKVVVPVGAKGVDDVRLEAAPTRRVGGRIIATDGAALPANTWVTLAHEHAWLSWAMPMSTDGSFEFTGVLDGGPYTLRVGAPNVMTSVRNASFHPTDRAAIVGMVSGDMTDMEIEIVPSNANRVGKQSSERPLRGVEQPQPK